MKYYAIRKIDDKNVNLLLDNWEECKAKIYKHNCEYMSFKSKEQAIKYLDENSEEITEEQALNSNKLVYYVDGSYIENKIGWSYVAVVNREVKTHNSGNIKETKDTSRNISGELFATLGAVVNAIMMDKKEMYIVHDYQGISSFVTGAWSPKTVEAKKYTTTMKELIKEYDLNIHFVKVKGHSDNEFNDLADKLAKEGAMKGEKPTSLEVGWIAQK